MCEQWIRLCSVEGCGRGDEDRRRRVECDNLNKPGHKIEKHYLDIPKEDEWLCMSCLKEQTLTSSANLLDNNRFLIGDIGVPESPASVAPSPGYNPPVNAYDPAAVAEASGTRASTPREVENRRVYLSGSDKDRWSSSSESEGARAKGKNKAVRGGSGKPTAPAGPSGSGAGRDKRKREGTSSGSAGGGSSSMSRPKKK